MTQSVRGSTEHYAEPDELTEDKRHRLLRSRRRRMTLDVLEGRAEEITLSKLAVAIAAREGGTDSVEKTADSVLLSLHHVHLPAMADVGVVDYDPEERLVRPYFDRLEFDFRIE